MGPSATPAETGAALAARAGRALVFRQVSAGGFHACAVTMDDRAYCWGANWSNQIGDGTTTNRLTPTAVLGGLRFRTVSAGEYHTCGLTTDGRGYCWGGNPVGELGDGTTTNRLRPVAVLGGLRFRQVEAGTNNTCGLRDSDRRAYCWGSNNFGQVGDGTKTNRLRPVAVLGGRAFRQISSGGLQTCAVTPTYQAYCWGRNTWGQLGDGTEVPMRSRPALVAGGHFFRQIDGNRNQTCALTTGGRAYCWGYGRNGEIGDGKAFVRFTPRAVAGSLRFADVRTGSGHTCGATTTSLAYCWGANNYGQLGDGTGTTHLTPVAVAGGFSFVRVTGAAGGGYACGVTPAGKAYCWGGNSQGQLGDGTTTDRLVPVAVSGSI